MRILCAASKAASSATKDLASGSPPRGFGGFAGSRSPSGGVTVTKKSTELPTYAAALITILVIGLVGGLVGIFVHRKVQAERGFRWVKFDEHDGKDGVGEGGEQRV